MLSIMRLLACLHSHEDIPGVVRTSINQAGNKAAYEQRNVGVLNPYVLRNELPRSTPPIPLLEA